MKDGFNLYVLRAFVLILTLLTTTSQGFSQSLSYVRGVALQTSYRTPTLPYPVQAVYGDFHNANALWVQLWKQTINNFTYSLQWQVKITPTVGDGTGEWILIEEASKITLEEQYKLGIVNDDVPGPLLQKDDPTAEIILSEADIRNIGPNREGLNVGAVMTYDDLVFPYEMPVYLCNTSDCLYVRHMLGRAELPEPTKTAAPFQSTVLTPQAIIEKDDTVPIAVWLWLAGISLLLLLILLALTCICAMIHHRKRSQDAYRYSTCAQRNPAYTSLTSLSASKFNHGTKGAPANKNHANNNFVKALHSGPYYTMPNTHNTLVKLPISSFRGPHSELSSVPTQFLGSNTSIGSGRYTRGPISTRNGVPLRNVQTASHVSSMSSGMAEFEETDSFESGSSACCNNGVIKF